MTLSEKAFALHGIFPFSELNAEELLIAATAFSVREFPAGSPICAAGESLNKLYVCAKGHLVNDRGEKMHLVVGATCLLAGAVTPFPIMAGDEGCVALLLPRGKFHTLINECPLLLRGLFRLRMIGVDTKRDGTKPRS